MSNTKYRIKLLALFMSLVFTEAVAQPACRFEHYSTADGLPQYTIMDMLQDKRGFMWFATWDGLSKFDGYHFRNFKVQPGDSYVMRSNRIECLREDKFGNIYIRSYDGEAHCFNPRTETFQGIHPVEGLGKDIFHLSTMESTPSGRFWLLSDQNGCVCILDSLFHRQAYNRNLGNLKGQCVHSVLEDRAGNSWLLTDNGLNLIPAGQTKGFSYFFENNTGKSVRKQDFFRAIELKNEILFGSMDGRIWKYRKKDGKFALMQLKASSNVIDFKSLPGGIVLIVTAHDGLFNLNPQTGVFTALQMKGASIPKSTGIIRTYLIKNKQLWIETSQLGIYKYDLPSGQLRNYLIPTEDETTVTYPPKTVVMEDKNGRLWIQPKGGGFSLYHPAKDELGAFYNAQSAGDWRFSNLVHSAYTDRQGNLWISTRSHGLEKVVFDKNFFQTETVNTTKNAVVANDVRVVFEDKDGNLFVSTKDRRIHIYDKNQKQLGHLGLDGNIHPDASMPNVVYCITQDRAGNIWMGTKGSGLLCFQGDGIKRKWHSELFQRNEADLYSLSDNKVYSIYQDKRGHIWVGTYDGGLNLVQQTKDGHIRFINHRNILRNYPIETASQVRFITENKRGQLCIGTTGGMIMFPTHFATPENIRYHQFTRMPDNKKSLSGNDVHGICNTSKGDMFLVTFGGGVNKAIAYDDKGYPTTFESFTSQNGLPSDVTLSIVEDNLGMLWISSENNLIRLNPKLLVFETFAEIKRLMAMQNFSEASTCKLKSGKIIFG
jgi:ligand-binding sensor domain-containing protein